MISIKAAMKNISVFKGIRKLATSIDKALRSSLYEIGAENVSHARDLMLENKTGRIYQIDGAAHQAAADGEAPGIVTKNLFDSLDYAVSGTTQVEFGTNAPYGLHLELGTKKMNAKPFLEPTIKDKQKDAYDSFVKNTQIELDKMK